MLYESVLQAEKLFVPSLVHRGDCSRAWASWGSNTFSDLFWKPVNRRVWGFWLKGESPTLNEKLYFKREGNKLDS